MLEVFSRTRAYQILRSRPVDHDAENDRSRVTSILRSIDEALRAAHAEKAGLSRRLDDVTARAAVSLGNDTDEYLTRDALDNRLLDQLEPEILRLQRRLRQLDRNIAHFEFVKTALTTRFPDCNRLSANA